jgi:hypothetical protein
LPKIPKIKFIIVLTYRLCYNQGGEFVPVISQFYGIIVRIYFKDTEKHYLEHIHVQYNEFDSVYSITDSKVLEGTLPPKQHKLVIAWMELHRDELIALWKVSQNDGEVFKINPLV